MNTPVPPKSNKTMIIVGVVICFLLIIGLMICSLVSTGAGAYFYSTSNTAKTDTTTTAKPLDPVTFKPPPDGASTCRSSTITCGSFVDFSLINGKSFEPGLTLDQCKTNCISNPSCLAVDYADRPSVGATTGGNCYYYSNASAIPNTTFCPGSATDQCFIKSTTPAPPSTTYTPIPNAVCRSDPGGAFLGSDYPPGMPLHNLSLSACKSTCDMTPGCSGAEYDDYSGKNTDGSCWIFTNSTIRGQPSPDKQTCYTKN